MPNEDIVLEPEIEKMKDKDELLEVIQLLTEKYISTDFRENVDKYDADVRKVFEIFEDGKYKYYGLSSNLGIWNDIRLHYDLNI